MMPALWKSERFYDALGIRSPMPGFMRRAVEMSDMLTVEIQMELRFALIGSTVREYRPVISAFGYVNRVIEPFAGIC